MDSGNLEEARKLRISGGLGEISGGHAIERLCCFRVHYTQLQKALAREGPMREGKRTKIPYANPNMIMLRSLDETIRSLEAELCLAPLRRRRARKVTRKVTRPTPADAWLQMYRGG